MTKRIDWDFKPLLNKYVSLANEIAYVINIKTHDIY